MNSGKHPQQEDLIDFAEGEMSPEKAGAVRAHLKTCQSCRAYLRSIERTLSVLARDRVPEQPPGYWAFFAQRVTGRLHRQPRRVAWALVPGLAAAVAFVILLWWLPQALVRPVDSVELILADMTTSEIVKSVEGQPDTDRALLEVAQDEIAELESYLRQTEDLEGIYELLNSLSNAQRERFVEDLEAILRHRDGASQISAGFTRKEC